MRKYRKEINIYAFLYINLFVHTILIIVAELAAIPLIYEYTGVLSVLSLSTIVKQEKTQPPSE